MIESALEHSQAGEVVSLLDFGAANGFERRAGISPGIYPTAHQSAFFHSAHYLAGRIGFAGKGADGDVGRGPGGPPHHIVVDGLFRFFFSFVIS
jgi:hypothetical protein